LNQLARAVKRSSIKILVGPYRAERRQLAMCFLLVMPPQPSFWPTHSGAEVDLFFIPHGRRYGVECKFSKAPKSTKSMIQAVESLNLDHPWVVYPGEHGYPLSEKYRPGP